LATLVFAALIQLRVKVTGILLICDSRTCGFYTRFMCSSSLIKRGYMNGDNSSKNAHKSGLTNHINSSKLFKDQGKTLKALLISLKIKK